MLILIVEDDHGIAFLISEALESADRQIEMVHSGNEAIEYISARNPELIILDYSLSDMNAGELIDALESKGVSIPPFIVSTGQGDETIAVEMMKMGALDYLIKDSTLMRRLPGIVQRVVENLQKEKRLTEALESKRISDEKLLEEQRRLANIIKATRVGTWEWNLLTDQTIFNERYANILGYTLEELMPTTSATWRNLTHPDDNQIALQKLDDHFNQKADYFEVEVRSKRKDGQWVWVLSRGCIMEYDADGKPLMMAGTMQDISDKKKREELGQQMEVAHKTLEFKQSFLASMSHEMRTPLTGILGVTELLEKTSLDSVQKDFVETLKNASENLRDIIDQVLDYSRIEAGKLNLSPVKLETRSLIRKSEEIFKNICQKPLRFTATLDAFLPEYILADAQRISQVINNLLSNAVKYSEEGEISLHIKKEKKPERGTVIMRVEISDTGMGIRPEKRDAIFAPFSAVNQIDTSFYEGTGLGLAICKEFVKMHGGDIGFTSQPGKGSTFWFTFKAGEVKNGDTLQEERKEDSAISRRGLHILLAEDKIITQKVLGLQLKDMGHNVIIAANGKEAIDLFEPGKFDMILMDIQMPVMDGITATNELKSKYIDLPPVIGLSANAFEGDREKYIKMGFDEYITKPMKRDRFVEVVNNFFPSPKTT